VGQGRRENRPLETENNRQHQDWTTAWARQPAQPSRAPTLPAASPKATAGGLPFPRAPKTKKGRLGFPRFLHHYGGGVLRMKPHLHPGGSDRGPGAEVLGVQGLTTHCEDASVWAAMDSPWPGPQEAERLEKSSEAISLFESRTSQSFRHIRYFPFSFLAFKAGQRKQNSPVVSSTTGLWDIVYKKENTTAHFCLLQLFPRTGSINFSSTEYSRSRNYEKSELDGNEE